MRIDSVNSEYYSGGPRGNKLSESFSSVGSIFARAFSEAFGLSGTFSDINNVKADWRRNHNVREMQLSDGTRVLGSSTTRFNECQPEWIELQRYMRQAANEMGLTLVYGDVIRTVRQSNAGRAKKGNQVAKGGESPHNYGVAADIVLFKNGQAINKKSDTQKQFAQRVKELSGGRIEWGGEWTSPKDEEHHFNIRNWKDKYKKPCYLVG